MMGSHWNSVQRIDKHYLETHLNRPQCENIKTLYIDKVSYKIIRRHLQKLLNYFVYHIASGLAEGLNNLIATVKKKAYDYRNREYFKLKIFQQDQKYQPLTHTNM